MIERESALLGPEHAASHARSRSDQCAVMRGQRQVPAQGMVADAADTLAEDAAVVAAADATNPIDGVAGAGSARLAVSGTITQAVAAASSVGRWSAPFVIPVVGITSVLLHTGKVLFWSYEPSTYHDPAHSNDGVAYVWDYKTRTGHKIASPENIWCGGQTILADGRVYIAGGNLRYPDAAAPPGKRSWEGALSTYTFNPLKGTWTRQPDMAHGRWYPTVTQLADNRVLVLSGLTETGSGALNNGVDLFTPSASIDGVGTLRSVGTHAGSGLYPPQFLLPSGNLLQAGHAAANSMQLNPSTWNWSMLPSLLKSHQGLGNGISYTNLSGSVPHQVIVIAGGFTGGVAQADNEALDGFHPDAGWKPYAQWRTPRHNSNTVILPDGSFLTVGGNKAGSSYGQPVFDSELYMRNSGGTGGRWETVAPHAIQAAYHSSAILLPDATVLLSQDDMDSSEAAAARHKAQVYSPPYLFRGARPKIVSVPGQLAPGQEFTVTTDRAGMSSVMLVAPGAVTHGNDMHQRAIKLSVRASGAGLVAHVPKTTALVPPGYYMLFVIDSKGIPSVATFVHITG